MQIEGLDGLTRVLQASISPVALVSGVGLLLLSETNRFGRVTDRLRELAREHREGQNGDEHAGRQVAIFLLRAHILRSAIGAALVSSLLASVIVLLIFAIAVFDVNGHNAVLFLFATSLLALITSLGLFIFDTHLSLKAAEAFLEQDDE